ncbi:MAG: tripartite tricarboxylate transporter substrate binding protein [Streptosporangiales bacterium]|nr:tripartite tricarboxylate transporter substrate binding protein [Streptosporangiales bacterium]
MRQRRLVAAIAAAVLGVSACGTGQGGGTAGSGYPRKPVTVTAPSEPGSGWDTTARALVQTLQKENLVDKPLPVQNRPGATGAVWLSKMVTANKGDPYQIAVTSTPIMSNSLRGLSKHSYQDVTMIAKLFSEYYTIATTPDSKYKELPDLINAIKKNPKSVPIGAAGDDRLPFSLVVMAAGGDPEKINFVNYEGGGEQTTALLNGDIDAAIAGVSELRGQLVAKKLSGLGVLKEDRLEGDLADIPTAKEQGYDVTLDNWRGVYGPPGMPKDAVKYWQDVLKKAMETKSWQKTAERNQWDTAYLQGKEMNDYLSTTNAELKKALESTGDAK